MGKTRIRDIIKKQWILIWLITVSIVLAGVIAFAAYKESDTKLRRVIAPSAEQGVLFSSNYLRQGTSAAENRRSVYFNANSTNTYQYTLTIRNYDQSDPGTIYNGTIEYELSMKLVHSDKNATAYSYASDQAVLDAMKADPEHVQSVVVYSGSVIDDDYKLAEFGWVDIEGESTLVLEYPVPEEDNKMELTTSDGTDVFTVVYNNIALDSDLASDLCVQFEAVPVNNTELFTLSGVIGISTNSAVHGDGWHCYENDSKSYEESKYDSFNYMITGTGDKILEFSYNSNYLEISPAFYSITSEAKAPVDNNTLGNGWKTVRIYANPNATANGYSISDGDTITAATTATRYDIQLYKVNKEGFTGVWNFETTLNPYPAENVTSYVLFSQSAYPTN